MTNLEKYNLWLENVKDQSLLSDLESVEENSEEIEDRFYTDLKFGTAGLRGVIGAGTNRMNIYTVGRATQGLALWLVENSEKPAVAVSCDSRIMSREFSRLSAQVLAANGIRVYIFSDIMPTPLLSYAVRELNCDAGIMITASHNPKEYNGLKCYGADGSQMADVSAGEVYDKIKSVDYFKDIKSGDFDSFMTKGLINHIEPSLLEKFTEKAVSMSVHPEAFAAAGLKALFTPLNGTGFVPIKKLLSRMGLSNLTFVESQTAPDGTFPTCPYPNPETRPAFDEAMKYASELKPELIFATDPDADRIACAVLQNGEYVFLTGNEVGVLFIYYLLSELKSTGRLCEKPLIVKTIVSSHMPDRICADFGCEVRDVLTGFKYIGDQILRLESDGMESRFVMGFEESVGYMFGTHVRDKDAVTAAMLLCEMASFYKRRGKTLVDVLNELYEKYGRFYHRTENFYFEGANGKEKISGIMENLRKNPPAAICGKTVIKVEDYSKGIYGLPESNVIAFTLEDGYSFIARPSGTEPKLKYYMTAVSRDGENELDKMLEELKTFCK